MTTDFYTMAGASDPQVASSLASFHNRNLADCGDTEVQGMLERSVDFFKNEFLTLPENASGMWTSGGSESNRYALLLARRKTGRALVIGTNLTHTSIKDSCDELGMEFLALDVDPKNQFRVPDGQLEKLLLERGHEIAALVVTCGTTQLGSADDVFYNEKLDEIIKKKGICLHLDKSYGGPYLNDDPSDIHAEKTGWQKANAVSTITLDIHKFIGPLGASILYAMNGNDIQEFIFKNKVSYFKQSALVSPGTTKSAFPAAYFDYVRQHAPELYGSDLKTFLFAEAQRCRSSAIRTGIILREMGFHLIGPPNKLFGETTIVPIWFRNEAERDNFLGEAKKAGFALSPIEIKGKNYQYCGARIAITPKEEFKLGDFVKDENNLKHFWMFCARFIGRPGLARQIDQTLVW